MHGDDGVWRLPSHTGSSHLAVRAVREEAVQHCDLCHHRSRASFGG